MIDIQVDSEVFEFLKKNAEPFVDSPNDVLRRLIFGEAPAPAGKSPTRRPRMHVVDTGEFVSRLLREISSEWGEELTRKPPYRYMFESDGRLLYVQNFNKEGAENLWYRINEGAMRDLLASDRSAWVCFTNPADGIAYLMPFDDIRERMVQSKWERDDVEVNVDHASRRWRDLDWDIGTYLRTYPSRTEDLSGS